MTALIEKRQFAEELRYPASYALPDPLEDVHLRGCTFELFQHPTQQGVSDRPTVRGLTVERCHFTGCEIGPVILEEALIDTIWIHRGKWGPQLIAGSAFMHVTIRGRVTGGIAFAPSRDWQMAWPKPDIATDPFVRANGEFYRTVDWALDLTEAEFTGIELSGCDVPARLIRRDAETQAVVTRDSLGSANWREACGDSAMWVSLERFLHTGLPDTVLIAGKRSRWFAQDMAALRRLREAGAALPE